MTLDLGTGARLALSVRPKPAEDSHGGRYLVLARRAFLPNWPIDLPWNHNRPPRGLANPARTFSSVDFPVLDNYIPRPSGYLSIQIHTYIYILILWATE